MTEAMKTYIHCPDCGALQISDLYEVIAQGQVGEYYSALAAWSAALVFERGGNTPLPHLFRKYQTMPNGLDSEIAAEAVREEASNVHDYATCGCEKTEHGLLVLRLRPDSDIIRLHKMYGDYYDYNSFQPTEDPGSECCCAIDVLEELLAHAEKSAGWRIPEQFAIPDEMEYPTNKNGLIKPKETE